MILGDDNARQVWYARGMWHEGRIEEAFSVGEHAMHNQNTGANLSTHYIISNR